MSFYATVADALATFDTPPSEAGKLAVLQDKIDVAEAELDREVGFDFLPHGPETRLFDGRAGSRLHVHVGIVGTPAVSFAASYGGTLTLVAPSDMALVSDSPESGSYDHIRLLGSTSGYGYFPTGAGLISITGTFGFARVPSDVTQAVVDRARQLFAADPSLTGGVTGPGEFGGGQILPRYPHTFYALIDHYRRRFAACWV